MGEKLNRLKFHLRLIAAGIAIFLILFSSVKGRKGREVPAFGGEDAFDVFLAEFVAQVFDGDGYIELAHVLVWLIFIIWDGLAKKFKLEMFQVDVFYLVFVRFE